MKRMRRTSKRGRERLGMLAFEWILLISLLVIGIIGGLSTVRNALICELGELAESITALNLHGHGHGHGNGHDDCDWPGSHGRPWWSWHHGHDHDGNGNGNGNGNDRDDDGDDD